MKLKGFMAAVLLTGLMIFGFSVKVEAIEEDKIETIAENKSELATWLDEDLKTIILDVGATMSGVILSMGLFLKSIKSLTKHFKKNTEENENTSKVIKDCEKEIKQTQTAIEKNNVDTLKAIQEDNAATREEIEKLMKVFGIAFSNDSKLVKNGAASEIMKVLGESNESTEA